MSLGWGIRKYLSWWLQVLIVVWLSVIFVLYMSPTKYQAADFLAGLLLVLSMVAIGVRGLGLADAAKSILPLFAMMVYMVARQLVLDEGGVWSYIQQPLYGLVPYFLFYFLFRNQSITLRHAPLTIMAIFILPGLVHAAYLFLDISLALQNEGILFATSSQTGLLEYVKESPRVGRRYVSVAMLHLLSGGLLMVWYFRWRPGKYWGWAIGGLSLLSLALLDARAAYASLIIGGLLLMFAVGTARTLQALKLFLPARPIGRLALVAFLVIAMAIGYSAGKSRWLRMSYSVQTAISDVFNAKEELAQRPYVNIEYWNAPIEDIKRCFDEGYFRCRVDQSAYLRAAWLFVGLSAVLEHPLGVGYSDSYMGRLWGVDGDKGKYQRTDSFLVENLVMFGLPGLALYALLWVGVLRTLRRAVTGGIASFSLIVICGIFLVCVGRSLVDVFSDGLWRYLMALLGMYYGLLHADKQRTKEGLQCKN